MLSLASFGKDLKFLKCLTLFLATFGSKIDIFKKNRDGKWQLDFYSCKVTKTLHFKAEFDTIFFVHTLFELNSRVSK